LQGQSLNAGNDAFTAKNYDEAIARYGMSERIAKAFGQVDTNAIFNSALAYESKGDAPRCDQALSGGP
jgi:ferritin-like metal-binding protein YciE